MTLTLVTVGLLINVGAWARPVDCRLDHYEDCPAYNASVAKEWGFLAGSISSYPFHYESDEIYGRQQEWLYHKPSMRKSRYVGGGESFNFTILIRELGQRESSEFKYAYGILNCTSRRFQVDGMATRLPWATQAINQICKSPQDDAVGIRSGWERDALEKQPKTIRKPTRPRTASDPSTMLACEQYSQLVYNHIIGNRTPPPMRQVVVINQRRPTEYEGEITGCGMFSCTVQLRETYRSRWNRQFRQTSDNLGQSLENLGYMIGSASAGAELRRNAENQKEAKYEECLRSAGYQ